MRSDVIGLITNAARQLHRKDARTASALYEMSNNLRLVMRGDATLKEWNRVYVGSDREPIDIDKVLPVENI